MKKMLFAVILLLILSNVNVYAQTDTEILFRDMPWGTSFSELKNIFPDFEDLYFNTDENIPAVCDIERIITISSDSKLEHGISGYSDYYPSDMSVAGYPLDCITFFLVKPVIDGKLETAESRLKCYAVRYTFNPNDIDSSANDLTEKLSGLYGEPDQFGNAANSFHKWQYTVWKGSNNTGVALSVGKPIKAMPPFVVDTININYFIYDGDVWLKAASDIQRDNLQAERDGNTSGL